MNQHADAATLVSGNTWAGTCYLFYKWRDFVGIAKWVGGSIAMFSFEPAPIKNSRVGLVFALTRTDPSVVLTARVLDRDNHNAILYENTVVDSEIADPTVTAAHLSDLSGMQLTLGPDLNGTPYTSGNALYLESWQYNNGSRLAAEVTYDNLRQRLYTQTLETPPVIGIEKATRLTWLTTYGVTHTVESAPEVEGPWSPLTLLTTDAEVPGMKQVVVPHNQAARFYRLIEAP
jgi:hypothetical protein